MGIWLPRMRISGFWTASETSNSLNFQHRVREPIEVFSEYPVHDLYGFSRVEVHWLRPRLGIVPNLVRYPPDLHVEPGYQASHIVLQRFEAPDERMSEIAILDE